MSISILNDLFVYGTVSANGGNSEIWNATYNTASTNSANWQVAYTNLISNSAAYLTSTDITYLGSLSGGWENIRTTVQDYSALWILSGGTGTETDPIFTTWANTYSANLQSAQTTVLNNSANWLQTLSFNPTSALLTISNGNSVSLSSLSVSGGGTNVDMNVWVTKNGTNQSIIFIADTPVLVTFGTEILDTDSRWSSNALTVNSGEIWEITGAISMGSLNSGQSHRIKLFKDGSLLHVLNDLGLWGAAPVSLTFHTILFESGTYDIRAELSTSATRDVFGDVTRTYFKARRLK